MTCQNSNIGGLFVPGVLIDKESDRGRVIKNFKAGKFNIY